MTETTISGRPLMNGTVDAVPQIRVLMLVASSTVDTGPVKGCLQLIQNIEHDNVGFILVNFRVGESDRAAERFEAAMHAKGVSVKWINQSGKNYWSMASELYEIIRANDINIVQSHGSKPAALCALLRFRKRVPPWICFSHGATREDLWVRLYSVTEDLCRILADRPVYVSESQTKRLLARINYKKSEVIRNAVDIDAPSNFSSVKDINVRAQLGLSDCDRLAVAVARLSPEKGLDVFIDALSITSEPVGQRLHVVLVGDGPERSNLAKRAESLHLNARVHFIGYSENPGDYLCAADVVVLPSRSEGIPNVALEAMALGKALVATSVGGVPEIVVDGETGLLIPPDDAGALSGAILRILNDQVLAKRLCENAKRHARNNLGVNARCKKILTVYREMVRPLCTTLTSPVQR